MLTCTTMHPWVLHLGALVKCKINNILCLTLIWRYIYNISRGVQLKRIVQISDEYPYLSTTCKADIPHAVLQIFFQLRSSPVSSWQNIDPRYKYRVARLPWCTLYNYWARRRLGQIPISTTSQHNNPESREPNYVTFRK